MNKIIKDKFYKSENSTLIVKALETTNSSLFEGEVVNQHTHFDIGYVGKGWFTGNFFEFEYKEETYNELFPIY